LVVVVVVVVVASLRMERWWWWRHWVIIRGGRRGIARCIAVVVGEKVVEARIKLQDIHNHVITGKNRIVPVNYDT
jgi:hypothetical protein